MLKSLVAQLRGDGYSPFIFEEDSLAKVQVGAFSDRAMLRHLLKRIAIKRILSDYFDQLTE